MEVRTYPTKNDTGGDIVLYFRDFNDVEEYDKDSCSIIGMALELIGIDYPEEIGEIPFVLDGTGGNYSVYGPHGSVIAYDVPLPFTVSITHSTVTTIIINDINNQ